MLFLKIRHFSQSFPDYTEMSPSPAKGLILETSTQNGSRAPNWTNKVTKGRAKGVVRAGTKYILARGKSRGKFSQSNKNEKNLFRLKRRKWSVPCKKAF